MPAKPDKKGALALLALAAIAAGFALRRKKGATMSPTSPSSSPLADDPIVGPAYPYLSRWTPDERRALYDAQMALGLDITKGALPGVIQHESGGNPAALNPLPAAGLVQITKGANLPGFTDADAIRAVATWPVQRQLSDVVVPLWKRFGNLSGATLRDMLRKNFLPGVANKPDSFVLGVKEGSVGPNGEKPEDKLIPGMGLTLGQIYKANPGFDPGGSRGYFAWSHVDADAARTEKAAKGWIRASGKIEGAPSVPAPASAPRVASKAPPAPAAPKAPRVPVPQPWEQPEGMAAVDALGKQQAAEEALAAAKVRNEGGMLVVDEPSAIKPSETSGFVAGTNPHLSSRRSGTPRDGGPT